MKLQQLRYIWEVAHNDLNVSATAQLLYTSQPGISKQIRLLEDELNIQIFFRSGKHLTHITREGKQIIHIVTDILKQIDNIKKVAQDFNSPDNGRLAIAANDLITQHFLPKKLSKFMEEFPNVLVKLLQSNTETMIQKISNGEIDIAIGSKELMTYQNLITIPCFHLTKCLLVPKGHPLTKQASITLQDICSYPLFVCVSDNQDKELLEKTFLSEGLSPSITLTATSIETIQTYTQLNLGIGLIDNAININSNDPKLTTIDVSHLFEKSTYYLAFKKRAYLREFTYDFIRYIAPQIPKEILKQIFSTSTQKELTTILDSIKIPTFESGNLVLSS